MIPFMLALALAAPHRYAVVVGSNDAPGRPSLRYAYNDAQRFAAVLERVGGFRPDDVLTLLDPSPTRVLQTLDTIAQKLDGREAFVLFYFSGHSDALPFAEVRTKLEAMKATVKLGIVDACAGGEWTQTKGFASSAPIEIPAASLASAGSAFIASSSGVENAHETEALGASFFTHHLIAGLSGAADKSGDGDVSLGEAFEYAKERTIRDTARHAPELQHPSFEVALHGRQDLVLASVSSAPSLVDVTQDQGPLEVIQLGSGASVLEVPEGKRSIRLALPPGKYLVRRREGSQVFAREVHIGPNSSVGVREQELELVGSMKLAMKGDFELPRITATTTRAHLVELRFGLGIASTASTTSAISLPRGPTFDGSRSLAVELTGTWGFTDRLSWNIGTLALAYRFGEAGKFEIVPRGGLTGWGVGASSAEGVAWDLRFGAGVDARLWLPRQQSLVFQLDTGTSVGQSDQQVRSVDGDRVYFDYKKITRPPTTWHASGSLGYTVTYKDIVTVGFGVKLEGNWLFAGHGPRLDSERDLKISFGSVQSLGFRQIPLVQFHITKWMSVDLHASFTLDLRTRQLSDRYMAGFTFSF